MPLTDRQISLILGMLERGDETQNIAACMTTNMGRVSEIKNRNCPRYEHHRLASRARAISPAKLDDLPDPGPYINQQEAIREMVEFVTGPSGDRDIPWPYRWVTDDIIVVAELDYDNRPQIEDYRRADLLAWHRRAKKFLADERWSEDDFDSACRATSKR